MSFTVATAKNQVIAAVITHQDRIGAFRRSSEVKWDSGQWHCVTGYVPPGTSPLNQAIIEVHEETGISGDDLTLRGAAVFDKVGDDGQIWRIHAFHFASATNELALNWEHDASRWVTVQEFMTMPRVYWLDSVLRALYFFRHVSDETDRPQSRETHGCGVY